MYYNADKKLFAYAALLRKHMTAEENMLWEKLRHSRMGAKFRRQHPISGYIVDFYCHQHRLVIEVDGRIHLKPEVKAKDLDRENELRNLGLKVLRFTNEQIRRDLSEVLETIRLNLIR